MSVVTRCIFVATSTGTGDFVVASAFAGYLTPAQANAVGGAVYEYAAQTVDGSGNVTAWEVGNGVYTSGTVTLARTNILYSSNSNNVVNFAAAPNVYLTAITLNNLTITTNNPIFDLTQTWNAAGVVFTGLKFNFTNTASAAGSKIFDFQVGGASCFNYDVTAGVLSLFKSTTAQTFRVYNTFTDASNYERAIFDWTTTANTLTIGPQASGTGSNRGTNFLVPSFFIFDHTGGNKISLSNLNPRMDFATNAVGTTVSIQAQSSGVSGRVSLGVGGILSFSNNNDTTDLANMDTAISRSAAGVLAFGNATQGDSSATVVAKTKAGAFVAGDIPSGTWALCRDTSGATTKLIYNNAGTLMTVALT